MKIQREQIELATPAGFEPATFSLEGCCYTVPGAWNCAGMEELGSIRQS
jgi:hypothetical protein